MKLPKRFREGDIVVFQDGFTVPLTRNGTADIKKGTPARIEKIIYNPSRNSIFQNIEIIVVLALCIGDIPEFVPITMEWAQEILEVKPAATVLYGDNDDKTKS